MTTHSTSDYDVVVIGGSMSGAATATLVGETADEQAPPACVTVTNFPLNEIVPVREVVAVGREPQHIGRGQLKPARTEYPA